MQGWVILSPDQGAPLWFSVHSRAQGHKEKSFFAGRVVATEAVSAALATETQRGAVFSLAPALVVCQMNRAELTRNV